MANFVMEGTGTVCILSGRTYTKVNSGFAVVGIYNNQGQYTGPLIVSKTAAAVTYSATSGGPWTYATTITHGGETWYVNTTEHFYGGNPEDTSGLDRYKCSATTPATAAEELLKAYEATLPYYPAAGQIADYTGTEFHQIGKLYEFGGSAFSPIARVYDWNGTAASLIYSDETEALTAYAWGGHYNPNGAFQDASYSNGKIIANATSYLCQSIWTTEKIDFSQFSKMRVNYTISASSTSGGYDNCRRIGFMANGSTTFQFDGGLNANQSFGRSNFGVTHQHSVEMWETSLISVGTHDAEFDISGWSGSLLFGVVSMCGGNNTLSVTFNSIIFE